MVVVLQALLDRHAMLRLRVDDDGAGGWSLWVPEAGSVDARGCLQSVEVLSDEALVQARSRLNPAAGVMLSAVWVGSTGQLVLIIHHLAVDGVSWRILLEDLNIAWAQHHSGQPVALPAGGTSFARWAQLLAEYARTPRRRGPGRGVAAGGGDPGGVAGGAARGGYLCQRWAACRWSWMSRRPGCCWARCPPAFHAGVHDILLIAFGLAWAQFVGTGAPIGIDVEGHGRQEELGPRCGLVAHGGLVHHQVPGVVDRRGAVLGAGDGR